MTWGGWGLDIIRITKEVNSCGWLIHMCGTIGQFQVVWGPSLCSESLAPAWKSGAGKRAGVGDRQGVEAPWPLFSV